MSKNNTNQNVWVSASAGSGKTKVLIDRFVKLLLEGVDARKIVCITFTKAAATEMLERVNQTLSEWSICNEQTLERQLTTLLNKKPSPAIKNRARTLLAEILDIQHSLQIKTIHSFCQTILSKFPIEAGIEINAQILEGSELENIQLIAQKHTLASYQESYLAPPINNLISNIHDIQLSEVFKQQLVIISQFPDFFTNIKTLKKYIENLCKKFQINYSFDTNTEEVKEILNLIKSVPLHSEIPIIKALLDFKSNNELSLLLDHFFTTLGSPRKSLINKKDSNEQLNNLLITIQNILLRFRNNQELFQTVKHTEGFLFLGHLFHNIYATIKKQKLSLDYSDLLHHTIELFNNPNVVQWVQYKLHYNIEHLLIDEAQDTNLLQWKIIDNLQKIFFENNNKSCSLFVVGDPKQSIYSFQGTSPEIFEIMKRINLNTSQNWVENNLTHSYRSDQLVLDFIDAVFNNITKTSPHLFYTENLKHTASRHFNSASVELLPPVLGIKNENDYDDAWFALQEPIKNNYNPPQVLAAILAKKIKHLINTEQYQPSDFLILVRKRDKLSQHIITEFKKLYIPISGLDRMNLNSSLAILDLVSIANFILLPHDDYNIASLLKSPIFNMTEDDLPEIAKTRESSIWNHIKNHPQYIKCYNVLTKLLEQKNKHKPFDLFSYILDSCTYRQNFIKNFGHQINETLDEFLNICHNFQMNNSSLTHFIHWFENSNIEIKRDTISNKNEVRLMTVHASKGLQAKYVILPDTTSIPTNKSPFIFDQKDNIFIYKKNSLNNISDYYDDIVESLNEDTLKEYYRLLYVALTRAKQHLLICGCTQKQSLPEGCWYNKVASVLKDKNKMPSSNIMNYKNISIQEPKNIDTQHFFISNESNIYYVKKDLDNITSHSPNKKTMNTLEIPQFLKQKLATPPSPRTFTPSNVSSQNTIITDTTILGTVLHKALETFVTTQEIDKIVIYTFLKHNLQNQNNLEKHTTALHKLIHNILLPQTKNSTLKKEVNIHKTVSKNISISAKIDLLIIQKNQVTIIDYKTTMNNDIPEHVYQQLALYFDAISEIFPTKKIVCKIISILTQKEFVIEHNILEQKLQNLKTIFSESV